MPRARSKNKFIRTFSLSKDCLSGLARHAKTWESKSATVERLLMAQIAFEERRASGQWQPQNGGTASNSQPQSIDDTTGLPVYTTD